MLSLSEPLPVLVLCILKSYSKCLKSFSQALGRGFDRSHHKVLLVGGGVGLAPLRFLAEDYPQADVDVLIGARTAEELFWTDLFRDKTVHQFETTEDGSRGTKGLITAPLGFILFGF